VKVQEEHGARGLVLIAVHRQDVPKDQVLALCRAHKVNYSVYGSGSVKGDDARGIPRAFLFNWKGEQVWSGHPASGMDDAIEEAIRNAPDLLLGPRKYEAIRSEASKILKRSGMGSAVKSLRKKSGGAEGAEKEEATELLGRLEKHAERAMKKADELIGSGEPLKAQGLWKRLARDFRGDEIGSRASSKEKEMKKDVAFKAELSAARIMMQMEAMADKIKPRRRGEDLAKWHKKNKGSLNRILGMYLALDKKFGKTKVRIRAEAFVRSMKLIE